MNRFSRWQLRPLGWLQALLYSLIKTRLIGPAQQPATHNTLRVYALLYPSLSETLVIDREVQELNWASPLDTANSLNQTGLPSFFHVYGRSRSLFHRAGKPVICDSLKMLAEWQLAHPDRPLEVVPVRVFWGRGPQKEGSFLRIWLQNSGSFGGRLLTLLAILFNGRNTFVHFSQPLSLQQLAQKARTPHRLARKTALLLRIHFRQVSATVIGPDLSHRRTLISQIPNRPLVQTAIEQAIKEQNLTLPQARQKTRQYADEIASNISYTTVRFMDVLLSWVWNTLYDGVQVNHIDPLKTAARDNEIIYVPCHRSHIDYLLLSYVLYHNGLQLPQIAAGINLNLPVAGSILRRSGAFFMRRSFRDNPLYAAVFDEYLHSIFTRGYAAEYFVEGGRSRTGRTLQPKAGMLAMTVRSYLRDCRKPILFMPVYLGYEKVFEAGSYQKELNGKKKRQESLLGVFATLKSFRRHFGKVQVTFGEPIYLTEFLNQQYPDWRQQTAADHHYRPDWARPVVDQLARRIVTGINQATSVNPINLVAMALLTSPREAMEESVLIQRLENWAALIRQQPLSNRTQVTEGSASDWIQQAETLGSIQRQSHSMGDLIYADDRRAIALTYYRNNVLHLLAIPSVLSCLLVHRQPHQAKQLHALVLTLYPYLQAELFLPWSKAQLETVINDWLDTLCQADYLECSNHHYCAVDDREASYTELTALATLMMPTLERYYLTLALLRQRRSATLTAEQLERQCSLIAQRISLLHGLNAPEFFDTSLFRTLVAELLEQQILTRQDNHGVLVFGEALVTLTEQLEQALDGPMRHSILRCI
ncbi:MULTISPECIES: glycerol-3-phosphate 1-O-acyltransferase PlsB [unclassified Oceanobacter]|uniref:glycerol-3-phosphate 1-O-acyltransferase PlsB n=1 Tax=unclassified Oceanobacter TaxID=2620260 RepID=UPI0027361CBD|nr:MULTISPECIES: glycerol-3-phosphate 1-O-acyltransferase PlsB [unclassified Oceanobacter]MDP2608801.1 glycerol-3-phosphate 1-O-acyltransferase PlsB [Oceanobacter sp. 1_MG-2023]MDP2611957.1 glycerol-3-phosphate 1-O-acyltransferase PlsB [Oceanobacter sp. 2_MG-2023]